MTAMTAMTAIIQIIFSIYVLIIVIPGIIIYANLPKLCTCGHNEACDKCRLTPSLWKIMNLWPILLLIKHIPITFFYKRT
jgi:hypothetical protein